MEMEESTGYRLPASTRMTSSEAVLRNERFEPIHHIGLKATVVRERTIFSLGPQNPATSGYLSMWCQLLGRVMEWYMNQRSSNSHES